MTAKYMFMKLIGLLIVTIGFSYCITSFYNLFDVLLGSKIIPSNYNAYLMGIMVLIPLFVFIFGVVFYLYADMRKENKALWILICTILIFIFGILRILFSLDIMPFNYIFDYIHLSFGYSMLILGILLVYGFIKYKY